MGISLKNLKKYKEEQSKVFELNFGNLVDAKLEGVVVPIKIKSFEESLKLREKFIENIKPTIEYKLFRKAGKKFRDFYNEAIPEGRQGVPTYVQICRYDKDESKFEIKDFRNRLFEVLIHFDMDYEISEGVSLWDDIEIKKDDYCSLVTLFSSLIFEENHLLILEKIIALLKLGLKDEKAIKGHLELSMYVDAISKIEDKEEREEKQKEFREQYQTLIKNSEEMIERQKAIEEGNAIQEVAKEAEVKDE